MQTARRALELIKLLRFLLSWTHFLHRSFLLVRC